MMQIMKKHYVLLLSYIGLLIEASYSKPGVVHAICLHYAILKLSSVYTDEKVPQESFFFFFVYGKEDDRYCIS